MFMIVRTLWILFSFKYYSNVKYLREKFLGMKVVEYLF